MIIDVINRKFANLSYIFVILYAYKKYILFVYDRGEG